MVMRRSRLEWFGHTKRTDETENMRAGAEMKMDEAQWRKPRLRGTDTVSRNMKAGIVREKGPCNIR